MKKFLPLLLVCIVFSCSDEESAVSPENEDNNGSKLKTVKRLNASGAVDLERNFSYNDDGNLSTVMTTYFGEETMVTFDYDDNGKMISFTEVTNDVFGDTRTEIDYINYENGLITQICQEISNTDDYADPEVDRIDFAYNGSGDVVLFTHYYDESAESNSCADVDSVSSTENLEYDSDGNMVRYQNSDYFFTPFYYTYEYDDANHPYSNMQPEEYKKLLGYSTVNNIVSAIEYNANTNEENATITYTYTLNDSGFPTRVEKIYQTDGASQTSIEEYEYY